jgi:hypothetical protein
MNYEWLDLCARNASARFRHSVDWLSGGWLSWMAAWAGGSNSRAIVPHRPEKLTDRPAHAPHAGLVSLLSRRQVNSAEARGYPSSSAIGLLGSSTRPTRQVCLVCFSPDILPFIHCNRF